MASQRDEILPALDTTSFDPGHQPPVPCLLVCPHSSPPNHVTSAPLVTEECPSMVHFAHFTVLFRERLVVTVTVQE